MTIKEVLNKNPNDVVIVSAVRTPITRVSVFYLSKPRFSQTQARKGGLAGTLPEKLLAHAFKEAVKRANVDPTLIEVCTIPVDKHNRLTR